MRKDIYYTLAFDSTHSAVAAEKYLGGKIDVAVMPTLRKITASCGISLRIEECDFEKLKNLLEENEAVKNSCRIYFVENGEVFPKTI